MVSLSAVRAHNSSLSSLPSNFVAVFVGGTSGIGLFTARQLVLSTPSPTIYLIGRNATEASRITSELQTLNPLSRVSFVQKDISLLRNVDAACAEIAQKEKAINLLFMTCGYLTLKGRDPTPEGLDRKFALHYYTRVRFIHQLGPLLTHAAEVDKTLSREVSVLDPRNGLGAPPNWDDLSLKTTFSLKNCALHTGVMGNLALYKFSQQMPGTGFVHAFPGLVDTGALRELPRGLHWLARPLMLLAKPFFVSHKESGERHLFAATAPRLGGQEVEKGAGAVTGSDGVVGSGSYLLNWDGEVFSDTPKAKSMREEGGVDKVWKHIEEVFRKVGDEGGAY